MTNKLFILYFHKNGARICGNYYGGIMYKDIFINLSLFYPDFYDSYEKFYMERFIYSSTEIEGIKTKEERKIVVDTFYDILETSKIESTYDLFKKYPIILPKMLLKYKSLSKTDRTKILSLINAIIKTYLTKNKKVN